MLHNGLASNAIRCNAPNVRSNAPDSWSHADFSFLIRGLAPPTRPPGKRMYATHEAVRPHTADLLDGATESVFMRSANGFIACDLGLADASAV